MACGSLGSARVISGRGTSLTLGPESMPSAGANHGRKLRCTAGDCRCRQEAEEAPTSACSRGEVKLGGRVVGERHGRGELSTCGIRVVGCAAVAAGGAAQTKCRACVGEGGVKENEGGGGGGGGGVAPF